MYLNRYMRFVGPVMFLTWFYQTEYPKRFAGSDGPMYKDFEFKVSICKVTGWVNALFISNYYFENSVKR